VCVGIPQRQEKLLAVLQRAHDSSMLKEEFYKNWVRRCLMARVNLGQQVYKHRLSNVQTYSIATNRIHEVHNM
jgi:hypothetical protein